MDQVTFTTKQGRTLTIPPVEFLHRLIQHILPKGFRKIRHAGLYGSVRSGGLLERARTFVGVCKRPKKESSDLERLEQAVRTCPKCGGTLRRTPLPASIRAPPGDEPC